MARPDHLPVSSFSASAASLVRAIHAAGADADAWPQVLEQLRWHLDARVVTLGHHEFATGADAILCESSDSGTFSRDIARFSTRNPWFLSSDDYVPGRVMTGDDLIGQADLRQARLHQDR